MFALTLGLNGRLAALAALAICAALGAPAAAQQCPDWRQNGAGITTDTDTLWSPRSWRVTAGGAADLANCSNLPGFGHVATAPDFTINYDARTQGRDLDFRVEAQCDTVLLVNDSSASWHYDDDTDGLNPRLRLSGAPSGIYDVWVGTWGGQTCPATLILETFPGTQAAGACPDWSLNGTPITTDANRLWTPQRYTLTAGGSTDLRNCDAVPGAGHVMSAPDFTIRYDAAGTGHDLDFRVEAQCDTVLLVNDSSAVWHYSDDEGGSLNPRLRVSGAPSGVYDVWVGTWGQQTCPATLVVETYPATGGAGNCPDWSLGGAELNLSVGANMMQSVVAGGPINLSASDCGTGGRGHVAAAPDFTLYYDTPHSSWPLQFSVQGQCDTVLLVNDATAEWWFNDDHSGLDPQVTIPNAHGGRYDIWVGTWGSSLCHATLTVSAQGGVLTK